MDPSEVVHACDPPPSGRWLLVGDGESWRAFTLRLGHEAEVECCRDESEAISLLARHEYLSMICDWQVVSQTSLGNALCRLARDVAPELPFLAATAPAAVLQRVQALEADVDDCVSYEIEISELLARARAIRRRRLAAKARGRVDELDTRAAAVAPAYGLSNREREVLVLLARGTHLKEIATVIGCSYTTVRTHLRRICRKLGCSGTREAIIRFFSFDTSPHAMYPNR